MESINPLEQSTLIVGYIEVEQLGKISIDPYEFQHPTRLLNDSLITLKKFLEEAIEKEGTVKEGPLEYSPLKKTIKDPGNVVQTAA